MDQRLIYQNDKDTADASATTFPTPARTYATLDLLKVALRVGEVLVDLPIRDDKVEFKVDLTVGIVGAISLKMNERIYLVTPTGLDGKDGFLVELIGEVQWISNGAAIPAAVGGRTGHKFPAGITLTSDSGLLLARGGTAVKIVNTDPAFVQLRGVVGTAIVRVFDKPDSEDADGVAPMGRIWF